MYAQGSAQRPGLSGTNHLPLPGFSPHFQNNPLATLDAAMSISPPPTPPRYLTDNERRFKTITSTCEWMKDHRPGGYHPVVPGDTFNNGQYRVIRKLAKKRWPATSRYKELKWISVVRFSQRSYHPNLVFSGCSNDGPSKFFGLEERRFHGHPSA